ncbi:MAG: ECF-type sigma factor [Aureliella sp.]
MGSVVELLERMGNGDREASARLLPLVYDQLRELAAAKLRGESAGHTLQATALVHEAYLRLTGSEAEAASWDNLQHFLGAAAEAMRRVLVDHARSKKRLKRGGRFRRQPLEAIEAIDLAASAHVNGELLLALDEALAKLAQAEPTAAELVKYRYFAGLTNAQAAAALGISTRTAERLWTYARTWLFAEIHKQNGAGR